MADRLRISGISTGYDTAQLIEQLMAVERRPVLLMQKQQSQMKTKSDAWRDVASRLANLKSKAAALIRFGVQRQVSNVFGRQDGVGHR